MCAQSVLPRGILPSLRRGAIDIGSGATKLVVADVDINGKTSVIKEIFFGEERPVGFSADYLKSPERMLSESIQSKGITTLSDFLTIGKSWNVQEYSAIATEVFRKATNGDEYLAKIRNLGIPVRVITQEEEAMLGYATGAALYAYQGHQQRSSIVWDSGGGSFQITTMAPDSSLQTYMGAIGALGSFRILVEEMRRQSIAECSTANPVSRVETEALITAISEQLPPPPAWLQSQVVIAIGGPNSVFQLAVTVLGHMGVPVDSLDAEMIDRIITFCVDKSDEELSFIVKNEYSDPPSLLVPKLCLVQAVMTKTRMLQITPTLCIGSCAGLLVTEEAFWFT